jgi:hypothetical protein
VARSFRRLPDSQGTSSVLYGDELKPELCGLFPESVLSALYGFFVAAVKDTFVIGFPSAEEMVNNPSELVSRGGDCLGFAEFPSDASKEPRLSSGFTTEHQCRRGL